MINYLSLACVYPRDPHVLGVLRVTLERYICSWTSAKQKGLLTCKEKLKFDGVSETWPIFRIEMTGILIKYGLIQLFSLASGGGPGVTPPYLYFQSSCMVEVLMMAVNNSPLRWLMHEGDKTVWTCGHGSRLNMIVRLNWIPLGYFMARKVGRLSLSLVDC